MVIYIESVFAFNVLVDYLLLFGAARLAGRTVARRRLLRGAAVGGAYAVVQLFLPRSALLLLLALALMGAAAFSGSGRAVKLTLLFFLISCGFGGTVVLLGQGTGSMTRLARGVVAADLPWGVFCSRRGFPICSFPSFFASARRARAGQDCPRAPPARHGQHAFRPRDGAGRGGHRPSRAGRPCERKRGGGAAAHPVLQRGADGRNTAAAAL